MRNKRQVNLVSTLAFAAAVVLPFGGIAADGPQPPKTRAEQMGIPSSGNYTSFAQLDTNKDGYITREEAKYSPALTRRFDEIDKDGDGRLSPDETRGWYWLDFTVKGPGDRPQ